jgi:hypothetical protein
MSDHGQIAKISECGLISLDGTFTEEETRI